jgi:TonB family protein
LNDARDLADREGLIFRAPVRDSLFSDVPRYMARPRCADTQPPEALTTPDPLLIIADSDEPVTVSFIVGVDGQVHSPLILQSGNSKEDLAVLSAVRLWRYRPATCNGVPTETEAKIEFWRR